MNGTTAAPARTLAPARARPGAPALLPAGGARPWRLLLAACSALAVASLVLADEPTYDPWAWIIWGREITEWNLVTDTGPSWKPLPVLLTTPFSLLGDSVAPELWLVVARAGGLLAIAMAYRLAARVAGWPAGVIAALALAFSDEFVRNFARGNSEGLLVALCLLAVERHLDGRRGDAFAVGFAAALLRPELWPFFGAYGLWLLLREPRRRVLVAACFAATALLWFLPEYLGSGNFLRAAERARDANPDSAAFAERPFLEVFRRSAGILIVPVLAGGVAAIVMAARRRPRGLAELVVLALAVVATTLMVAVALMTEAGFAGNLRYVALPAALVCVISGAGWVWLVRAAVARAGRRAAVALALAAAAVSVPFAVEMAADFRKSMHRVHAEATLYDDFELALARTGGLAAAERCGTIFTGDFQLPHLAWRLHMHVDEILPRTEAAPGRLPGAIAVPGTIFSPRELGVWDAPGYGKPTLTDRWSVRRRCDA